jgi:outer membrane receptor protein involved in Fe transport
MRSTRFRDVVALVTLAAVPVLAPGGVFAQPAPPPPSPPSIIGEVQLFGEEDVTIEAATKTSIPLSKAPGSVSVITARQIRESGARTIPELLRLVSGVNVRWNPMVQTIDMRGFGENPFTNRVLLLIDGVPYNDWNQGGFPQHPGLDFFVLQNVKRLEVLKGPGSALYGENAFWGVINIVTLSGEDLEGGELDGYGGGVRDTASGGLRWGRKVGQGSVFLSAKYLRSQLPTEFWMDDKDVHWKGSDLFAKGTYKGLQASYYRHEDKMGGFDDPIPIEGLPPTTAFKSASEVGQTVDIAAVRFDQDPKDRKVAFSATGSYAHRLGTHCAACHAATQNPAFSTQESHGYQLLGDTHVAIRAIPHNDILVGLEERHVDAGQHVHELSSTALSLDEYSYSKLAAYVQDQISLAKDKVTLVGGLRYDAKTALFPEEYSPRVSLVVNPTEPLVLRAGYGTAFRFPNFSELAQDTWFINVDAGIPGFPVIPLAVFKPNPTMLPEEARSLDGGLEYRFSASVSGKVDFYHTRLKHFVVISTNFVPPPGTPTIGFENQPADATIDGVETELRWNVSSKTTGFVNYAYQKDKQDGIGVDSSGHSFEFVYSPENKINVGVFLGPFSGLRGSFELSWKDKYLGPGAYNFIRSGATDPALLFQSKVLDGYTLVNAKLTYDLPFDFGNKKRPVRLGLSGRNLLDRRPEETFVGVPMNIVGREVFGEMSVDF